MRLSKWLSDYYSLSFLLFFGNIYSIISEITYVDRAAGFGIFDRFGPVKNAMQCRDDYATDGSGGVVTECQCRSQKSTFLHFNNSCVSKKFVRNLITQSGCSSGNVIINKAGAGLYGSYMIFDLHETSSFKLGNEISAINDIGDNQRCVISNIHYIDGTNGKLIPGGAPDVFTINTTAKEISWVMIPEKSTLHGKVIRLQTRNCTFIIGTIGSSLSRRNPCIVFKAQGRVIFPPINTTVKPSTSIIKTDSSSVYSTSTISSSINSVTSSAIPVQPSKPAEQSAPPVGAIVGSVAGILVIVIVIILIFIWRRRKRTTGRKSSKAGNGQRHKDNPTYGKNETIDLSKQNRGPKITGNELEYDYAAVDGDPRASNGAAPGIYQSLIKDPNRESVYTPLEREEANQYNKVERAPFQPARNGPTDPTYNVLERPSDNNDDYLEPGSHIDKNKRPHSKLAPQNNEPVYNVLEGPNQEGEDEPEYNVLEDPDGQDDPEYNVLEDPDDNYDNAPVETARGHPSSHDNVGYASTIDFKKRQGTKNEPVYEAPEGPSSELTYQPLQINGQDNVYQPLDRTSRTIPDDQPVYHVLESQGSEA